MKEKKMKLLVLKILFVSLLFSCTKDNIENEQLTYNDFKVALKQEMDFNAIVEVFGEPQRDIGSGIHIYVYELNDSTEIWIGYTDQIIYARHLDQEQNILHTLI